MYYLSKCDILKLIVSSIIEAIVIIVAININYYIIKIFSLQLGQYTSIVTGFPIKYNAIILLLLLEIFLYLSKKKHLEQY